MDHVGDKIYKKKTHKNSWLINLRNDELYPVLNILEEYNEDIWEERERHWIEYHKKQGCDLTNNTNGGCDGYKFEDRIIEVIKKSSKNRIV